MPRSRPRSRFASTARKGYGRGRRAGHGNGSLVKRVATAIVAAAISTRTPMPFRLPYARIAFLFLALFAVSGRAADFVDSAERYVAIPDRIGRVMAADQSAAVLVFVLAPEKLVGWSRPLTREQRAYLPAKFARLPSTGQLSGPTPTASRQRTPRCRGPRNRSPCAPGRARGTRCPAAAGQGGPAGPSCRSSSTGTCGRL